MEIFNKNIVLEQTWNELFNPETQQAAAGEANTFNRKIISDSVLERCQFVTKGSGARVEILKNYQLGIEMFNAEGESRFRYYVDGTLTGDLVVGNLLGNYWWWDDSAGVMTVKGHMTASTIESTDISGGTITGALIRTSTTGKRIVLSSNPQNKIEFYSNNDLLGTLAGDRSGDLDYIKLFSADDKGFYILKDNDVGTESSFAMGYDNWMIASGVSGGNSAIGFFGKQSTLANTYFMLIRAGTTYQLQTDLELTMGSKKIINLGAPTGTTDATTKKYVDDADDAIIAAVSSLTSAVSSLTSAVSALADRVTYLENNCC